MKKMFLAAVVLFLSATQGFCQESSLQLIIKSDKEIYSQGEQIKLSLTFRNTSKKRISICLFDIEHRLKERLSFRNEGYPPKGQITVTIWVPPTTYKLKDWTKRKLPIVTGEDFIFLEPQEEYNIELIIDTVIPSDSSWRYIYDENEHTWKWGEGFTKLPPDKYQIIATYENSIVGMGEHGVPMQKGWRRPDVIIEMHNIWTGSLTSNAINIEVIEKQLTKDDAIKMKNALIEFMENSKDEDIKVLLNDVKLVNPEVDEEGTVRIGTWQYKKKENVLSYEFPFTGPATYWYYADIIKENNSWIVKNIRRMEIFK